MKRLNLKQVLLIVVAMAFAVACEKKREERFGQDDADKVAGLFKVSDYQNKSFSIETMEAIGSTKARILELSTAEKDESGREIFPLVSYKTTAPVLNSLNKSNWPLSAKANSSDKYSFVFQLTRSHMIVYLKAKPEDLSATEKIYAKPYGDYVLAPQFTMEIGLFKIDNVQNQYGEKSTTKKIFPVEELEQAEYFKPRAESVAYMSLYKREFIFPKSFFDGEWFFASTIIEKQEKEEDRTGLIKGLDLSVDTSMEAVSRVKFNIEQYRLSAKNTNVDAKLTENSEKEKLNQTDVLSIPAASLDFTLGVDKGGKPSLDEHIITGNWEKRKYVQLDFNRASSLVSQIAGSRAENDSTLVDLQVDENYFGFTILYNAKKTKVRYSLKRAPEPKKGRKAISADIDNRFGFFTTSKHFVRGAEHVRINDYERNIFMNRFMPEPDENGVRKIVYHFSKGSPSTPSTYREAAIEAIRQWNVLFAEIGSDIQVSVDTSFDVDLGDIRYNIINLIDDKSAMGGLLGYGPSISDTKSGEIVSATSNIYLSTFRAMLINHLRDYIYYANGKIKDTRFYDSSSVLMSLKSDVEDQYGTRIYDLSAMINKITKGPTLTSGPSAVSSGLGRQSLMLERKSFSSAVKSSVKAPLLKRVSGCGNFSINEAETIEKAKRLCPEMESYIADLKSQGVYFIEGREVEVLNSCAEKLLGPELVHTVLHELGHNFGLRHNFYASSDIANFSDKGIAGMAEAKKNKIVSASIMDYLAASAPVNKTLGSYDKAAIAYAYEGKAEVLDASGQPSGRMIEIDSAKSLADNEKEKGVAFRKFRFCSDEEVNANKVAQHPLCMAHDWGASPLEIVQNKINDFNSFMATARYRFDMIADTNNEYLAGAVKYYHIKDMMRIYGQWRVELAKHMDKNDIELYRYDTQSYKVLIDGILARLQGDERRNFVEYYAASRLIGDFVMNLALTLPKMCVVNFESGIKAFSFESLAKDINSESFLLASCTDRAALDYFANLGAIQMNQQGQPDIREQGEVYSDIQTNIESRNHRVYWMPDVVGVAGTVEAAGKALTEPADWSREHERMNFHPILLQEPDLRDKYIAKSLERVLDGFRTEDGQHLVKGFTDTQNVDSGMMGTLSSALKSLQSEAHARIWSEKFVKKSTYNKDQVPADSAMWIEVDEGSYWYAGYRASYALQMMNKYDELRAAGYYVVQRRGELSQETVLNDMRQVLASAGVDEGLVLSQMPFAQAMKAVRQILIAAKEKDTAVEGLWNRVMFPINSQIQFDRMLSTGSISEMPGTLESVLKSYMRDMKSFSNLTLGQLMTLQAQKVVEFKRDELQNLAHIKTLKLVLAPNNFGQ